MKKVFDQNEWNDESSKKIGLPRPFFRISKDFINAYSGTIHKKIPIPWQSKPEFTAEPLKMLGLIKENERLSYSDDRCAYCGIKFDSEDYVIRWTTIRGTPSDDGPNVISDNHPFHIQCMKQGRIYCPFMKTTKDEEFEFGLYKDLKNNAKQSLSHIINNTTHPNNNE